MRLTTKQARAMGIVIPKRKKATWERSDPKQKKAIPDSVDPFLAACVREGLPEPIKEYQFAPPRKWCFDYLFDGLIALEVEGGVWVAGRHNRGKGFLADMEKYNEAAILGYVLLRCTPQDIETGAVFALIKRAIEGS